MSYPQWVGAVDMNQLMDAAAPVVLPRRTSDAPAIVQAEYHSTFGTQQRDKTPCVGTPCTKIVDPVALFQASTRPAANASGTELVMGDAGIGHVPGAVSYKVWVPSAGNYRLTYRAISEASGGQIALSVNGAAALTTTLSATTWGDVTGPVLNLTTEA